MTVPHQRPISTASANARFQSGGSEVLMPAGSGEPSCVADHTRFLSVGVRALVMFGEAVDLGIPDVLWGPCGRQ